MDTPKEQVTCQTGPAWTYNLQVPGHSWGIFCISKQGDLFLNSDWGFFGCAFRSHGKSFKEFLISTNADYIYQKFDQNTRYLFRKGIPKQVEKHVVVLIEAFRQELIKESLVENIICYQNKRRAQH